jgi:hypothetical protein
MGACGWWRFQLLKSEEKGRKGKGREGKEREEKGREEKGREGKRREEKGRDGKRREEKGREGKSMDTAIRTEHKRHITLQGVYVVDWFCSLSTHTHTHTRALLSLSLFVSLSPSHPKWSSRSSWGNIWLPAQQ